jgi:hypothetical protein
MFNFLPETDDSTPVLLFSHLVEVFFHGGGTRPLVSFTDDQSCFFSRTIAFSLSKDRFSSLSGTQLSIEDQGGRLAFHFGTPAISFFLGIMLLFICDLLVH